MFAFEIYLARIWKETKHHNYARKLRDHRSYSLWHDKSQNFFTRYRDILRDILRDIENVKNDRYFATNFWLFICFRPNRTTMTWRTMCPSMLAGPMILWPSFSRKWVYLYLCWKHRALETGKIIILFCYIYTRSFSLALSFKFSSTISLFPTFFFLLSLRVISFGQGNVQYTSVYDIRWIDDGNFVKMVNKIGIEIDFFSSGEFDTY